jgi:hypothetical protein
MPESALEQPFRFEVTLQNCKLKYLLFWKYIAELTEIILTRMKNHRFSEVYSEEFRSALMLSQIDNKNDSFTFTASAVKVQNHFVSQLHRKSQKYTVGAILSHLWDLNPKPLAYEANALPLS